MTPAPVRVPRPVTPIGIAAEELAVVLEEAAELDLPPGLLVRLQRAHQLVAGLDNYLEECTTPASAALDGLAVRTAAEDWEHRAPGSAVFLEQEMLSGHVEGQFLRMVVLATRARRVLEVGMFTGYSALAMAEALPSGGRVVACELDPGVAELARMAFAGSPAGEHIDVRVGPASSTLAELEAEGASFDLVFIDADKPGYLGYLEQLLAGGLLSAGALVCVDNTLLQGQPWSDGERSPAGQAVVEFNRAVAADPRVEQVLVPLRDGVTLIRRVEDR